MTDSIATIQIKNLRLHTIIGVYEEEKKAPQEILITLTLTYDAEKAAKTDNPDYMLDYDALSRRIQETVENNQFELIERLADQVLAIVMEHKEVIDTTVTVDKPAALKRAESVSVSLSRTC